MYYKNIILFVILFIATQIAAQNVIVNNKNLSNKPKINLNQAENLAQMPIHCSTSEYPNKLNQVIASQEDLKTPKQLHPAFFGCFDWHSAVHGHWSMVVLLKNYPKIKSAKKMRQLLKSHITKENITKEVAYFHGKHNKSWERTYGWAWLLKLAEELHTWDDDLARELENNLQPLTDLIANKFIEFLPKLYYPIRVGEHPNTAFGMTFAYDYAKTLGNKKLQTVISKRALDFYKNDKNCPISWEPGGFDFLSPCLQEMSIMQRVMPKEQFLAWLSQFLPQLNDKNYQLAVGIVSDRTDGKLVHLDGVNFSRAWCLYDLANALPKYRHLAEIANQHVQQSMPYVVGDDYAGGHWLASFLIYALQSAKQN